VSVVLRGIEERSAAGDPIRVGLVGAGFAGRGFALRVVTGHPGMRLVAVANRTIAEAERAYADAGVTDVEQVSTQAELDRAIAAGRPAITDDPSLLTAASAIEAIVEATGEVEAGAHTAVGAIDNGKHIILINAELDSTLGSILKTRADRAGVVLTDMAGDQPGVLMDLLDEVRLLGFRPIMAGNIKSLLDHRRTPETQRGFAEATFQRPKMVTSFADGTKISAEMAVVANATGFGVSVRGMEGPRATRVEEAPGLFDLDALLERPIVDYIIGAEPSFGVFILGHGDNDLVRRYMKTYKMGDGPVYTFYRPYHLSPFEVPVAVARAVLFNDPVITPLGAPVCEVVSIAKRDLKAGEVLDGIGGFTVFGDIENAAIARSEDLLPIGLSDGARLRRGLPIDSAITFADVDLPPDRLSEHLWREQLARFDGEAVEPLGSGMLAGGRI
jgi:predicted homoserine dehydrogenase-like protein